MIFAVENVMKHLNRIISGTTSRHRFSRDDTRVANGAKVNTVDFVIVVAKQLQKNLGGTIYGGRTHDGLIRCHVFWRFRAEDSNRTGCENAQLVYARQLDHVSNTIDIHIQSQLWLLFTSRRQDTTQVNDPVDAVLDDQTLQSTVAADVSIRKRPITGERTERFAHIRGQDIITTVDMAQTSAQLSTNLTQGTSNHNAGVRLRWSRQNSIGTLLFAAEKASRRGGGDAGAVAVQSGGRSQSFRRGGV
mmetsp:Transcript_26308/g.66155  ORF Transcript_26308/g.66155 Transcript_26308/m.66155 type:complete len:247 (-) Transcript_26308:34-774(-)